MLVVTLAGLLWYFGSLPLHHTDLWGHLSYGRWMAEHRRLPRIDPFLPWSLDRPLVDTAWLSQCAGDAVYRAGGLPGLQLLQGGMVAACCGLLAATVFSQTRRWIPVFVAVGAFVALERFQFRIIRPQMAGLVCFLLLDWMLVSFDSSSMTAGAPVDKARRWWPHMLAVGGLFVLWANLHGSFVIGLAWLAGRCCGTALDVTRSRGLRGAVCDSTVIDFGLLTVTAALAGLVTPYGPRLYGEVLSFAANSNLRDLIEWAPLRYDTWQGRTFLTVAAILAALTVVRRRQISFARMLPVLGLGVATAASARMLVWWSPLAAGCLAHQLGALWPLPATIDSPPGLPPRPDRVGWTILALSSMAAAIGLSPLGRTLWSATPPDRKAAVSPQTPVEAVAWLTDHPQPGQMFCPYEWGDYLVWAGPQPATVFVTSNAHLIPGRIWRDYRTIVLGERECLERLDVYDVNSVLLDPIRNRRLAARLSRDTRWEAAYGDGVAVVYVRR